MIAAVTGATGYAGQFIVGRLIEEGVEVRAWRRPGSPHAALPPAVHWVEGSLDAPETFAPLVHGAAMLVHAALDHAPGRYRGGEGNDLARFLRTNVGGSLQLLDIARRSGVDRAVVLSSRAVFGALPRPAPIFDCDAISPDTHYGAAKASLEAFAQSWGAQGWAIAALRPTGIYGVVEPVERSKWYDLVSATLRNELAAGGGAKPADGGARTEVHGRDVAAAVWRLLTAPAERVGGRAFNCSDIVVSTRDVIATVHRVAGTSAPLPPKGGSPGNVMSSVGLDELGVRFGGVPLFEATVAELVARCRVG